MAHAREKIVSISAKVEQTRINNNAIGKAKGGLRAARKEHGRAPRKRGMIEGVRGTKLDDRGGAEGVGGTRGIYVYT